MDSSPDRFVAPGDTVPWDATRMTPFAAPDAPTILVAAQDDESRQILVDALKGAGYTVWQVAHGTDALRMLMEAELPVVLVVEEELPEFGGFHLAELLSLADAGTLRFGVVVLTASLGEALRQPGRYGRDTMALEVLVKPFHINELLLAVGFASGRLMAGIANTLHEAEAM